MGFLLNNEDTPYSSRMNHKSVREKERRDEINNKINELRNFVCEDEMEKRMMKQADVLTKTVELVHRMENESPGTSYIPERKGFVDGFALVENEVYNFIKRLGVDSTVCEEFIQNARNCFDQERNSLLLNKSPTLLKNANHIRAKCSPDSVRSTPSPFNNKDRKEIKKNREQDRRDRQGEAIEALKNFLISINGNKSARAQVEKMQRLNTLENIIEYIRNKKNNFVTRNTQEQGLYQHAFNGGFEIAKRTAIDFFRRNKHLCVRAAALEQHLDFSRRSSATAPTVLPSFPPATIPMPLPVPMFPQFNPLQFLPNLIQTFNPNPFISRVPSPSYSLESPPPSSDTSSLSSTESSPPTLKPQQKSSLKRPLSDSSDSSSPKVWRPWE